MKTILLILFLMLTNSVYSQDEASLSLSIGSGLVALGHDLDLDSFKITYDFSTEHSVKVKFVENSLQWIRIRGNLVVPKARVVVELPGSSYEYHLSYLDKSYILQQEREISSTQIEISLFHPHNVDVYKNGEKIGEIAFDIRSEHDEEKTKIIDNSCAPFGLEVKVPKGEFISIGCNLHLRGVFGSEKALLEISWMGPNLTLLKKGNPPYKINMATSGPAKILVNDQAKKKHLLEIKANVPPRMYRMKTALGFGPYTFDSKYGVKQRKAKISGAAMLYAKFDLTPHSSLRAFDALVWEKSIFNNFGLYFAYTVASVMDNRVLFVPLLGMQGLVFKYESGGNVFTQAIFPQGIEIVYKHAFGLKNWHLIYGMFLNPSDDEEYSNLWVRFGKRVFGELNYISWEENDKKARMFGLSMGIPFFNFF